MTESKRCSTPPSGCGLVKPLEEFGKHKRHKDGRETRCCECIRANYRANREKRVATVKKWYEANRENVREVRRRWAQENPERAVASNKANQANKRAKRMGVFGKITPGDVLEVYEGQGRRCLY
jgi:hypothetical protein